MKLDPQAIKRLCKRRGLTLQQLLRQAEVSRTAYYSLARRESVLPRTIRRLAGELGVAPWAILAEAPAAEWRARALLARARDILRRNPGASFDNVWHTLVLLDEPPIDRLRRSLQRGRGVHIH